MKTKTKSHNTMISAGIMLLVFIGWLSMSFVNYTQDDKKKPWVVPDKSKAMKNPVKSDDASLASGKALYAKHCKSCHGSTGKGDGPKSKELDTPTGDFTTDLKGQTDGELFFKIKEGRDDMPGFGKKIPEDEEIWAIVNYVHSLAGAK